MVSTWVGWRKDVANLPWSPLIEGRVKVTLMFTAQDRFVDVPILMFGISPHVLPRKEPSDDQDDHGFFLASPTGDSVGWMV